MIIVTGSVQIKSGKLDAALQVSLAHVRRSRLEDGCISHAVYTDAENPSVLFFYEQWNNHPALMKHFAVPESQQFVKTLSSLAVEAPQLNIFEAQKIG